MGVDVVTYFLEVTPLLAEFRRLMSRLQETATLPLDVVDDAAPSRLRCRLTEMNPGWRAMKRALSVINDNASACFPGSASTTVI